MTGTGEKILRCAQNDNRGDRMTGREAVILRRGFPPSVILRSESDEESLGPCLWDRRKDSSLRSE